MASNFLAEPLPSLHDVDGASTGGHLPKIIDSHVHLFPDRLFEAVREWFAEHGFALRYRMKAREVIQYLLDRGVHHIIALQYSHKPGMAQGLNQFMLEVCQEFPGQVTGLATVFPGEQNAKNILLEAFRAGLGGVKLHAHVQCFDMTHADMIPIYECCIEEQVPLQMHVGREPNSPAYKCDPYKLCSAEKLESILQQFPDLKICVPHLGINETNCYRELIEEYDNLWLDTAMAIENYFPGYQSPDLSQWRLDRLMYGSDFPNIPFAWDRELLKLQQLPLDKEGFHQLFYESARTFWDL